MIARHPARTAPLGPGKWGPCPCLGRGEGDRICNAWGNSVAPVLSFFALVKSKKFKEWKKTGFWDASNEATPQLTSCLRVLSAISIATSLAWTVLEHHRCRKTSMAPRCTAFSLPLSFKAMSNSSFCRFLVSWFPCTLCYVKYGERKNTELFHWHDDEIQT